MLLLFIVLSVLPLNIIAFFNLDTDHPILYESLSQIANNSKPAYFGYTVSFSSNGNSSWIFIGAPGEFNHKFDLRTGMIYRCNFKQACSLVDLLQKNNSPGNYNNMRLSSTMDTKKGKVITCAPNHQFFPDRLLGSCLTFHENDSHAENIFVPLNDSSRFNTKERSKLIFDYGQGQAGFSLHIPQDRDEFILGAPGVYNWKGTSMQIGKAGVNIASPITGVRSEEYFGYSITSGYFYNSHTLYYVSGAPRANYLKGRVIIYTFTRSNEQPKVKAFKDGTKFGEYFGSCLSSGDVNNDGLDDLFVGAPYFHSGSKYNQGAVYVFLSGKRNNLQNGDTLVGHSSGGLFGSAMQFLKGVDYNSLVVSAPNEESGVVYFYKSNSEGLDKMPYKKIAGKSLSPINLRGFGMSISKPFDIDNNGHPDLAFGAPLSGHVVVFRTAPKIIVFQQLKSDSNEITDETHFAAQACFHFISTSKNLDQIDITRTLVIDKNFDRVLLKNASLVRNITITRKWQCENLTMSINTSATNKLDPIVITLERNLVSVQKPKSLLQIGKSIKGIDNFCPDCPVETSFKTTSNEPLKLTIPNNCGPDKKCQSNVTITSRIIDLDESNILIVGSKSYLSLETTLLNQGEDAFEVQILVTLPKSIYFREVPTECQRTEQVETIICVVDDILKTNETKTTTLNLDVTNLNQGINNGDTLEINTFLTTKVENLNSKNKTTVTIFLKHEADVAIIGKSEIIAIRGNILMERQNFVQLFEVEKTGVSTIDEIIIRLKIPHTIQGPQGNISFLRVPELPVGSLGGQPILCTKEENIYENELARKKRSAAKNNPIFNISCSLKEVLCLQVTCMAGPFHKGEVAMILVYLESDFSQIKGIIGMSNRVISLSSDGEIEVVRPKHLIQTGDKPDHIRIYSEFLNEEKKAVALYIILLSVCVGLLLLCLAIGALVKVGFFKRKILEELEQLKQKEAVRESFIRTDDRETSEEIDLNEETPEGV